MPSVELAWALIFDIALLAALIFGGFELLHARKRSLRAAGMAIVGISSGYALFQVLHNASRILYERNVNAWGPGAHFLKIAVGGVLILLLVFKPRMLLRVVKNLLLIFAAAPFVFSLSTLWAYHSARVEYAGTGSAAGMLPVSANHNRVVWIIFDELDSRMLFDSRPRGVEAPQFDRLRSESLVGTQTTSPSYDTLPAISSLLTGKFVASYAPLRRDIRLLECQGKSTLRVNFSTQPNVFKQARAENLNVGVSGWAYPYCRVAGPYLSDCAWDLSGLPTLFVARALNLQPFYKQALYLAWWQSRVLPFASFRLSAAPDEGRMSREGAIATLHTVVDNAARMLRNRDLNMVYIHLPIPHPPGIWDSKNKALTTGQSDYVDNLALADELLGRFRRELEAIGDWDRTTVLVSADHPYRPEWASWYTGDFDNPKTYAITHGHWQPYIPFLVKLPYQHHATLYTRSFNSIVSGNLLLAALQGKIQTPEQAVSWLDANAEPHPGTANGVCLTSAK